MKINLNDKKVKIVVGVTISVSILGVMMFRKINGVNKDIISTPPTTYDTCTNSGTDEVAIRGVVKNIVTDSENVRLTVEGEIEEDTF